MPEGVGFPFPSLLFYEGRTYGQPEVVRISLPQMDKICYSCKSYHAVATGACDLYWNSMLCERLAGRTGILLRVGRTAKFLKLSDLCIKIKFIRLDITLLVLL